MNTILLIEDNEDIRENTAEILEMTGYTVVMAENGRVGVEKALVCRPDLVICDIMMPVMDGYAVLHIFNKNPLLSSIPFIFLTAKNERTDFRKGMELGADDYLTKPFDDSELISAIEGRLNRFTNLKAELEQDKLQALIAETHQVGDLQSLSTDRKVHAVPKKQYVYLEGDQPSRLFFIQSGTVKTMRSTADGKGLVTGIYNAGDFFGYFALLEESDYTDSALTLEDSVLVYIPQDDFRQLLAASPAVSAQFIKLLASQVGDREVQLLGMAYNSLRRRVADTLLRLHEHQPDGLIQLSRTDLAGIVGTANESLIRTLSEFKQDGLIELPPTGGILVTEPKKLRQANW
ncbi:response regulator [Fibrivirga algicola]|uniref:Response regulator n=1 Tax=Fibrivirga algicola TaxID=2950420 RepID=A0ABX0QQB7_9BACT|nr:response regulator [Fibrivirga algicola]NID13476.1 response regulator [Fibrivirga algicola]